MDLRRLVNQLFSFTMSDYAKIDAQPKEAAAPAAAAPATESKAPVAAARKPGVPDSLKSPSVSCAWPMPVETLLLCESHTVEKSQNCSGACQRFSAISCLLTARCFRGLDFRACSKMVVCTAAMLHAR